jgi:tRNA (uracil-5-)-methyltransferase
MLSAFDDLDLADKPRFLVDAYCGSGLFSVTCNQGFESVLGIEISEDSVKYAALNATRNNVVNAKFVTGTAEMIFEVAKSSPDQTALIIDPPRKGCDEAFLEQLLKFNPRVVIYVSCNVHTQARDIDYILRSDEGRYKVTAIRGFDLFPQTYHVESIATIVRYQGIC